MLDLHLDLYVEKSNHDVEPWSETFLSKRGLLISTVSAPGKQ